MELSDQAGGRRRHPAPLPFFGMLLVALAATLAWAVSQRPRVSPAWAALLLGLLAVHVALHWRVLRSSHRRPRVTAAILTVQLGLATAIGAWTESPLVTLTLGLPVLGEAAADFSWRWGAAGAALVVGLSAGHAAWAGGVPSAWALSGTGALCSAFVVFWVEMFQRQACQRALAQENLEKLDAAHRQLADYAARVEELTLLSERRRVARELHDTLAQGLAGLVLQLEAAGAHLERKDPSRAQTILTHARERARAALAEARAAIDDLRAQSGPLELKEALRREVERFQEATGIPCELRLDEGVALTPELASHAQRCVSEGLANSARHARASRVVVSVQGRDGEAWFEVEDDGAGFEPERLGTQAGHYGLLGLRERARLAGGTLEVASRPGHGTRLRLRLPRGALHG